MKTAFAYARVSTKEQALRDNSIPAQFNRIDNYCEKNDIEVVKKFFDSESAYHDDKRDNFYRMIEEAKKIYPDYIITDDSSRFARQKSVAVKVKKDIRDNGINILFANEPNIDPESISGVMVETFQEAMNQVSSMQTAFHVRKGMNYNVQNRDSETGWCYKNGGSAPFGYKSKNVIRGNDTKGKPILKLLWEIDEEKAKIVRYVVKLYVEDKKSYGEIRDILNLKKIKTNKGNIWSTSSIVEMLKPDRLQIYTGDYIWNRTNTSKKIGKYKPIEEWIIVENSHPAIITKDDYEKALRMKKYNRKGAPAGKARNSQFLFTGRNIEQEPMFICTKCGSTMIGSQNKQANYYKYVCSGHKNKGNMFCDNSIKIDRVFIESKIIHDITSKFLKLDNIQILIDNIKKQLNSKNDNIDDEIKTNRSKLDKINIEIQRLVNAIKMGVDPVLINKEINKLNSDKNELQETIKSLQYSYTPENKTIPESEIRTFLSNISNVFDNASYSKKRELIRTFVRRMTFNLDTATVEVEFYDDSLLYPMRYGEPYHK